MRRQPLPYLVALAASAILTPWGRAQAPAPPATTFGESVAVDLMTVEVLAVDGRGQVVRDLTREDFRLFEDGRPATLTHFERPGDAAAAAGAGASREPGVAAPASGDPPAHVVVMIDNTNIGIVNRHALFTSLYQALDAALRPGDEVMVVDYDGGTRIALPFSSSRQDLVAALERQRDGDARYLTRAIERSRTLETLQRLAEIEKRGDYIYSAGCISVGLQAWDYAHARHSEVLQTIGSLRQFVGTLSGVPGRKALIYVSDGVPMSPGAAEVQYAIDMCDGTGAREGIPHATGPMDSTIDKDTYWDPTASRLEIISLDTSNDWYLLTAEANAHRVAFYPLQVSGLTGFAQPIGSGVRTTTTVETMLRRDPQDTLVLLAAETGGTAILHGNDVGGSLGDALQRARDGYVLGFTPAKGGEDRRHAVRVEVTRPGVELRYPRSYLRKAAHGQMADAVASSLLHGVEANPMHLQLSLAGTRGPAQQERLRVSIPLDSATLLPAGDRSQGLVTVFVVTRPEDGSPSAVRQKTIPLQVPAGGALAGQPFVHEIGLALGPGKHQIAVGVYDEIGGTISYLRRDVVVDGEGARVQQRG